MLIDQVYLFQAVVGAADGGSAVGDGAHLAAHAGLGGGDLDDGLVGQRGIDLIADGVGEAVGVGAADGGGGDVELLAVGGDGDDGHDGGLAGEAWLGEAESVQVEEAFGALGLLRHASSPAGLLLALGYLGSFGYEVDGVLAREAFDVGHGDLVGGLLLGRVGRHTDGGYLLTVPCVVGVGAVEHDVDGEGAVSARREQQVELGAVAGRRSLEGFHALGVLVESAEAEVLEADDALVGDAGEIHVVVPHVVVVLQPVVARHVAGNAGGVVAVGGQAEDLEALAGDLGSRVAGAVGGGSRPLVIGSKGVVGDDAELAALGDALLVPRDLHRGHHRLTCIAEAARGTVVEDVPLAVDLLQRTVRVVCRVGGDELRAVLVGHHAARVDEHAARAPGAEGRVAVGITEGGVGGAEPVVGAAIAREDHHVLVAHLADAGGLEEVEVLGVLSLVEGGVGGTLGVAHHAVALAGGDEVVVDLRSRAQGVHGVGVELAGGGVLEAEERVSAESFLIVGVFLVVDGLDEYRGVEVDERAGNALAPVVGEVDGCEGPVGTTALADGSHAAPSARVGIEVVDAFACLAVVDLHEVGGEHRVPLAVDEPGEDGALVAPLAEVLDGCRPHADVVAAVAGVGDVV